MSMQNTIRRYPISVSAFLSYPSYSSLLSNTHLGGRQGALEAELCRNTLDAMGGVEVLHQRDLVASRRTLARDDRGVGEEELPDLRRRQSFVRHTGLRYTYSECSVAILAFNLLSVRHPILIPFPQRGRVVYANGVDPFDLKPSSLELVDKPPQRCRSIGAGENVLVHEETPDEVFILPRLTQTCNLQEENAVVLEHVVDLFKEGRKVSHADVLGHLETSDLVIATFGDGDIAVIHTEDLTLILGYTRLSQPFITPSGLVSSKSHTRRMGFIVHACKVGECAPSTADVEEALTLLEANLLADDGQLVILQLFKRLLGEDI